MPQLSSLSRVKRLPDALAMARPAMIQDFSCDLVGRPVAGNGSHQVVTIEEPPTVDELKALSQYTKLGASLFVNPASRELAAHFGNSSSWFLPQVLGVTLVTNTMNGTDPHLIAFAVDGLVEDSCVACHQGLTRVRNLSNESGVMPYRNVRNDGPYNFDVAVHRLGLAGTFTLPAISSHFEAYGNTRAILNRLVSQVAGRKLTSSFALTGLPRAMSLEAKAEAYFLFWADLERLVAFYGNDFFAAFNPGQGWTDFFML